MPPLQDVNFAPLWRKYAVSVFVWTSAAVAFSLTCLWQIRTAESVAEFPLVVDVHELDAGEVWHEEPIIHTFRVFNRSNEPVRLKGLASSCSCALAEVEASEVAVGGALQLSVRVDRPISHLPVWALKNTRFAFVQLLTDFHPTAQSGPFRDVLSDRSSPALRVPHCKSRFCLKTPAIQSRLVS